MTIVLTSLVLLLIGAATCALLAARPRAALLAALVATAGAALGVLAAAFSILCYPQASAAASVAWPLPLGTMHLAVDGLSAWFLLGIGLLSLAAAVYSWPYMRSEAARGSVPAFGSFLCLLVMSMILLVIAADVVVFLVGWEGMSLAAFFLVAYRHGDPEVRRGAWMYLIATHVGTALCLLPMFGIATARAGGTDFAAIARALPGVGSQLGALLFVLGLIGFGTKAGFMPMHVWLPVAHPAAPTPVSALLSGIVIKTGIYGLLRVLSWLPPLPTSCGVTMLAFGMISGVLGVLYALAQHDLKRLLAYHSVENIGIIGLGMGMGMLGQSLGIPALTVLGYTGALLHVLNHALFKGLLFLSAGAVIHSTGTGEIDRLGGLARKTPINAALFLIAAISICGLPPFNGFVSEWILYGSLLGGAFQGVRGMSESATLGAVSLALMGGLALACFAKVFSAVFLGRPRDESIHAHGTDRLSVAGMGLLAAMCVLIGVCPGLFVPLTRGAVMATTRAGAGVSLDSVQQVLAPMSRLSAMTAILLVVVTGLAAARAMLLRRRAAAGPQPAVDTWGCGYAGAAPRAQYTASSFAWPLVRGFRHLLWPEQHAARPAGCFPIGGQLETHTADMAEQDLFAPLFRGIAVAFEAVRTVSWPGRERESVRPFEGHLAGHGEPREAESGARPMRVIIHMVVHGLRRGSIQVYLAFMVLALLAVFSLSNFRAGPAASASQPGTPSQADLEVSK